MFEGVEGCWVPAIAERLWWRANICQHVQPHEFEAQRPAHIKMSTNHRMNELYKHKSTPAKLIVAVSTYLKKVFFDR